MCGISGGTHIEVAAMQAALARLSHRGPDAESFWREANGALAMGHNRLAIIDLNPEANQPMRCPRTGNVLVFNGEIYNFRAVREKLRALGWEFRTRSDTEVLLAAYGEWGAECLPRLNGMFAFVLYDPTRRRLFVGRDRVGKKPLYYTLWNNEFLWASEIKGILAMCPNLPRTLNLEALQEYLLLGYIPGELSIYREVHKLAPAHYGLYDLDARTFTTERYWQLPAPSDQDISEDEAAEELEYLLQDAVKIRLESDVPIGILLSGGLDSSLVAAMTVKANPGMVAYTAQFPVAKYDETAIARRVAEWIGATHRIVPIEAQESRELACLAEQFDEPLADSSLLPTYMVSRAINQHVKVALSGDGGDELFAGYSYYDQVRAEGRWERAPHFLRSAASPLHHLLPVGTPGKNFLRRLPYDGAARFRATTGATEHIQRLPMTLEVERRLRSLPRDAFRTALEKQLNAHSPDRARMTLLQQMTRLDFLSWMVDDVLVKVDRASMLTALEVRSPLLDYRIVELAFRLPDRLRLQGGVKKYLLKRVARKYLPPEFPFERKQGFNIPEGEWFRQEWRGLLPELLTQDSTLLDREGVLAIQKAHETNGRYGKALFKMLMLAQFERSYGVRVG